MNSRFYKIGIGISIALIGILVILFIMAKSSDNNVAELEDNFPSVVSSTKATEEEEKSDTEQFNEIKETENNNENNKIQTQNTQKDSSNKKVSKSDNKKNEEKSENIENENNINIDPVFSYPVDGEVVVDYAKDKLTYSNTLGEWITHMGIDIKADKTTIVKSSADGTIKAINNDPRYGLTVVIEHNNNYKTVYSNLLTAEFVHVGEKVTSGQTIGTVGNTAPFEILDEPHLHFEIMKDNEQIDPNMYLKK